MAVERIAVVGSGVTGLVAAAGFAHRGYPVLLCGEVPPPFDPAQEEDLRVLALNDASCALLRSVDAWDAIAAQRVCYYERMEIWSAGGRLHFDSTDIGRAHLGVIVENRLLRAVLFERLQGYHNATIHCPAKLRSMHFVSRQGGVRLVLDDGHDIAAALVVGADGADSQVRIQSKLGYRRHAYGQCAIVATVECESEHRNTCLQRFSEQGVTAFLPLSGAGGRRGSIVWSCDARLADELGALSDAAFCSNLSQVLEYRLGHATLVSQRAAFPLHGALARDYIGHGVALIGDAAHSVHPLAGQGANMGFADVRDLLESVARSGYPADDASINRAVLRRYERNVKGRNMGMKYALDAIHRWFTRRGPLADRAQAAGLNLVEYYLPLKTWFMRKAMGLDCVDFSNPAGPERYEPENR